MNSVNYIFLNTLDSPDISSYDASFPLNLKNLEHRHNHLKLDSCSFVNGVYPINISNNTLIYEENSASSTTTTTITPNSYTGSQLATFLQTQMNLDTQESTTYTVSYDVQSKKLTISGSNNFRLLGTSTCLSEIGFNEMDAAATTRIGDWVVRLDGTQYVDIISSLSAKNISSNDRTSILARVYMTAAFGELQTYQSHNSSYIQINPQQITGLKLRLTDDKGNIYQLMNNCQVNYTFELN